MSRPSSTKRLLLASSALMALAAGGIGGGGGMHPVTAAATALAGRSASGASDIDNHDYDPPVRRAQSDGGGSSGVRDEDDRRRGVGRDDDDDRRRRVESDGSHRELEHYGREKTSPFAGAAEVGGEGGGGRPHSPAGLAARSAAVPDNGGGGGQLVIETKVLTAQEKKRRQKRAQRRKAERQRKKLARQQRNQQRQKKNAKANTNAATKRPSGQGVEVGVGEVELVIGLIQPEQIRHETVEVEIEVLCALTQNGELTREKKSLIEDAFWEYFTGVAACSDTDAVYGPISLIDFEDSECCRQLFGEQGIPSNEVEERCYKDFPDDARALFEGGGMIRRGLQTSSFNPDGAPPSEQEETTAAPKKKKKNKRKKKRRRSKATVKRTYTCHMCPELPTELLIEDSLRLLLEEGGDLEGEGEDSAGVIRALQLGRCPASLVRSLNYRGLNAVTDAEVTAIQSRDCETPRSNDCSGPDGLCCGSAGCTCTSSTISKALCVENGCVLPTAGQGQRGVGGSRNNLCCAVPVEGVVWPTNAVPFGVCDSDCGDQCPLQPHVTAQHADSVKVKVELLDQCTSSFPGGDPSKTSMAKDVGSFLKKSVNQGECKGQIVMGNCVVEDFKDGKACQGGGYSDSGGHGASLLVLRCDVSCFEYCLRSPSGVLGPFYWGKPTRGRERMLHHLDGEVVDVGGLQWP